jgi:hypothetical protein
MQSPLILISLLASLAAFAATFYLFFQIRRLNHLRDTFFSGKKAADLEELLESIARHIVGLERTIEAQGSQITALEDKLTFAVQKIGIVRFNPFGDNGGNFSFSIALLDANKSGLILTSMHGREQSRVYCKRLEYGKSETQLTTEETQALEQANS